MAKLQPFLFKEMSPQLFYQTSVPEAGIDEAGRGCLAGPVFAAAVILPPDFRNAKLTDSKLLSEKDRESLRPVIESSALAWAVATASAAEIDEVNILQATFLAMHRAVDALSPKPELLLIDGNRFKPYFGIAHQCFVKGDSRFAAIAAASVLAKTHRDEYMLRLARQHPQYGFEKHKGYPTRAHREAIAIYGFCEAHRKTFRCS